MAGSRSLSLSSAASAAESSSAIAEENWKLLYYLNFYRLALALLAAGVALAPFEVPPFGEINHTLFVVVSLTYFGLILMALAAVRSRFGGFENQATLLAFLDISAITLLSYTSGGLDSGIGLLLIITIAATSLMLNGRMTVFFASLATIAIILEYNWEFLNGGPLVIDGYPQVAMLGVGLYVTAGLAYFLAVRLRATEQLALQRGIDLENLGQINELIIRNMQSGVIVCDRMGNVRAINNMARKFFGVRIEASMLKLADVSPELAKQLQTWLEKHDSRSRHMIQTKPGYTLLPRFVVLGQGEAGALVFLEDTSILKQQAQQLKMAALARLTASIAHEIRNPLGAITNAAQLLAETSPPNGEDRRLVQIIEDQSKRMNVIIENVLQLSRRDHANPVRFDLHHWLVDFAAQHCSTTKLPIEALTVTGLAHIPVNFDQDQLFQVITNLCQNALRHSPPFSGKPLVELRASIDEENHPCLDVMDWGSGVPANVVDNIFDPFFTTSPKGTGLGLYIARELCEGNGARINYYPSQPAGSRFRLTFAKTDD